MQHDGCLHLVSTLPGDQTRPTVTKEKRDRQTPWPGARLDIRTSEREVQPAAAATTTVLPFAGT